MQQIIDVVFIVDKRSKSTCFEFKSKESAINKDILIDFLNKSSFWDIHEKENRLLEYQSIKLFQSNNDNNYLYCCISNCEPRKKKFVFQFLKQISEKNNQSKKINQFQSPEFQKIILNEINAFKRGKGDIIGKTNSLIAEGKIKVEQQIENNIKTLKSLEKLDEETQSIELIASSNSDLAGKIKKNAWLEYLKSKMLFMAIFYILLFVGLFFIFKMFLESNTWNDK